MAAAVTWVRSVAAAAGDVPRRASDDSGTGVVTDAASLAPMGGTSGLGGVWGILRTSPPSSPPTDTDLRACTAALSGLVTVGAALRDVATVSVPAPSEPTDGRCLAVGVRALPASAAGLVWFAGRAADPHTLAELWHGTGTADAAVIAAPVTDAIKRVSGGRVRGVVPREGLCVPTEPLVVRIHAARSRLLPALDAGHDPIPALAVVGLVVHVVLRESPTTFRSHVAHG